jgi:hypothetical protein
MLKLRVVAVVCAAGLLAGCGGTQTGSSTATGRTVTLPSAAALYRVPSGSMAPTLTIGTRVEVAPGTPKVGEIAIFHPPEGGSLVPARRQPRRIRRQSLLGPGARLLDGRDRQHAARLVTSHGL